MTAIFDTNVWVALFNEIDAHHEKAMQLYTENPLILIPEYVILETTTVLQIRASKPKADLFVKMINATSGLEILHSSTHLFQQTLIMFTSQAQKLSFVDCALLVLAKTHTVYTFDEALAHKLATTYSP